MLAVKLKVPPKHIGPLFPTVGVDGTVLGAAVPVPEALVQPFTVCVTE